MESRERVLWRMPDHQRRFGVLRDIVFPQQTRQQDRRRRDVLFHVDSRATGCRKQQHNACQQNEFLVNALHPATLQQLTPKAIQKRDGQGRAGIIHSPPIACEQPSVDELW